METSFAQLAQAFNHVRVGRQLAHRAEDALPVIRRQLDAATLCRHFQGVAPELAEVTIYVGHLETNADWSIC